VRLLLPLALNVAQSRSKGFLQLRNSEITKFFPKAPKISTMSRSNSQSTSLEADDEIKAHLLEKEHGNNCDEDLLPERRRSRGTVNFILTCWCLFSTALCLILVLKLLFWNDIGGASPSTRCAAPLKETHFYRDTRMMTLDHANDYLWEEALSPLVGVINEPSKHGGNDTFAAISM
jgi:hypothetical protein